MQCNKCRREAILFQEYSGQHLCKQHVEADVEVKAKYEIRRHRWMIPGDHIAVALSGGKNSSALLYFFKKLTSNRRDIRISAITIDEGIAGFRDPGCAMRIANALGIECIPVSFLEVFGITADEFAHQKGTGLSCTYCRVIKNSLLNRIAGEHGVTKLALGETLDDGAVSVLKNILQGAPERLVGFERTGRGKIPWIRPFISIPQKEVALYADLHLKGCTQSCCPYKNDPFEGEVQTMLNDYTTRHPATKYALANLRKNLTGVCGSIADLIPSCAQCGEPTNGECPNCRIIGEVTSGGT
ncbi:MAG TPA: ATP-binding protein [Methanoregula sp.]|nr:ATP-binding protein [Methanoregula sp.]